MGIEIIEKTIAGHEGGYVNDPDDRGGETYKGISRKWWPNWKGWEVIDRYKKIAEDDEHLNKILKGSRELDKMVYDFYFEEYYKEYDQLSNLAVQEELYDTSVNLGVPETKELFQEALNLLNRNERNYDDLVVDGTIGPVTMAAYEKCNHEKLVKTLNLLQGEKYLQIVREDHTQEKFFNGWLDRV